MAGYTRQEDANIATGNTIQASHLDNEFDQVVAAFNETTGHKHDGTAAEGPLLVAVGALNTGSITSGFGAIDNGTSNITTGGLVTIDVDGTALAAAGSLTLGAGNDAGLFFNGTDLIIRTDGVGASGIILDAEDDTVEIQGSGVTQATFSTTGLNLVAGDAYSIGGTSVLSATTLGSGVTASSLTSLGTVVNFRSTGIDDNASSLALTIDSSQRMLLGHTASVTVGQARTLQVFGTGGAQAAIHQFSANATGGELVFSKSRGALGTATANVSGDDIALLRFYGVNTTPGYDEAARITVESEGTITAGAVPGVLFIGTANSSGTLTEALRIDSAQAITFKGGTQDYKWAMRGSSVITLQGQSAASDSVFEMFTNDGDSTDSNAFRVYARGTPSQVTNIEYLQAGWAVASSRMELASLASGTGTLRPLHLYTGTNTNQIVAATAGTVGIGVASPDGTLHVHTATAGVITADANSNDLIVENSGNTGISLLSPDTSVSRITFGSPSDSVGALVQWDFTADQMRVGTQNSGAQLRLEAGDGVTGLLINSSADVLVPNQMIVGTTATGPDGTFHVFTATAGTVSADLSYDDLVVETSGSGGMSILVPDASVSGIAFGSPSDAVGASITWDYGAAGANALMTLGTRATNGKVALIYGNGSEYGRIDAGRFLQGHTASVAVANAGAGGASTHHQPLQIVGASSASIGLSIIRYDATVGGPNLFLGKSHTTTLGGNTIVIDTEACGTIGFGANDGTDLGTLIASITAQVNDASPAASSIGGRLKLGVSAGVGADDHRYIVDIFANGQVAMGLGGNNNGNMTGTGLTVKGSGTDDQIFALKDSDVATGLTTATGQNVETDDLLTVSKVAATLGGVYIQGMGENSASLATSLLFQGYGGQATTTKSTGSDGLMKFSVAQHDGANALANLTANGNAFSWHGQVGGIERTLMILDAEGTLHLDDTTSTGAWDDYDDAGHLLPVYRALTSGDKSEAWERARNMFPRRFDQMMHDGREVLTHSGVLSGDGMLNIKAVSALTMDAIIQVHQRQQEITERERILIEVAEERLPGFMASVNERLQSRGIAEMITIG